MTARYPRLFATGRIGPLAVRNRILMAPMEKNLAAPTGAVTQRYVDYCEARAAGGAGLILLESMYVDPVGKNHTYQLGLHDDALVPGYRRLIEACHRHGAAVGAELQLAGRQTSSAVTGLQPVAPSAVPCAVLTAGDVPRALAEAEIPGLARAFADGARRAVAAGFDAVEIHGAHGYLVGQFLSPLSNRRDDAYGGDLARRLRFPLEVVAAVREAVGNGTPLLFRLSADEHVEGGVGIEDACRIAEQLEAAGVDLLDVSAGVYDSAPWIVQPMEMPQGCLAPLARQIRRHVRIPVSVAGRITDAGVAERILEYGDADFVSLGRALHADPEWPAKSREGREGEICACIGCLTCSDLLGKHRPVLCLANTATAREREYAIRAASHRERVTVVGAGPAGLEAARILALRGHRVTVLERAGEPGGQLLLARGVPGRSELAALAEYLAGAAARAGAVLRLGVEATADVVLAEAPTVIVLATGARPGVPAIPGILESPAADPFEVLRRPAPGVRRALVIGGGLLGVAVAHVVGERGAEVTLAEPGDVLVPELGLRPRWRHVADLQARPNVTIALATTVEALGRDVARLRRAGVDVLLRRLDLVVPASLMVSGSDLGEALAARAGAPPVFAIGDALQPGTAFEAMQQAAALGHRL